MLDVLATRLASELDDNCWVSPETHRRALKVRVHDFVQRHLADPDLSPADIAAAHDISLRMLYNLFQIQGLTVAGWIRSRRLQACQHDLVDPAQASRPVAAIAAHWGFRSPNHFNRLFRSVYGLPPHEYRRTVAGSPPADHPNRALTRY
ncbi:helix-turn-helix domain-containing protein [Actinoplanes sp. NPDC051513]|uniref:helix-turn-helix domain-containing protein n=1 Tax=Actinoplanes sp. NPDC051513 TaxID=3363908 RepID=UPI0037A39F9B